MTTQTTSGPPRGADAQCVISPPKYRAPLFAAILQLHDDNPPVESVADVRLDLFNDHTDDPFWNVTVKGMPVARVNLSDQVHKDELGDFFVTDTFGSSMREAMAKLGVYDILEQNNARFYAAKVTEADLATGLEDAYNAQYSAKFDALRDGFRESFQKVASVAMEGLNKNWWNDQAHPLKEALYTEMESRGVRGKADIIEAAFQEAGSDFLTRVVECTYNLMDMEPEAYAQVATHIAGGNVIGLVDNDDIEPTPVEAGAEYSRKLAQGNVPLRAMGSPTSKFQDRAKAAFQALDRRSKGMK